MAGNNSGAGFWKPTGEVTVVSKDNDSDCSSSLAPSSVRSGLTHGTTQRDEEVRAIQMQTRRETTQVTCWRWVTFGALLATALAVTLSTYSFLAREQHENFIQAFNEYSTTVRNAAVAQQQDIREAFASLAHSMTATAATLNATWPFYTQPLYESFAADAIKQGKTEMANLCTMVEHDQQDAWLDYAGEHYKEWIYESHMMRYGNLTRLNKESFPYRPYINRPSPEGFVPDSTDRDRYWLFWMFSPPPSSWGPINWNLGAMADFAPLLDAIVELKSETLTSPVRPYVGAAGLAFTAEEHAEMHDELPDSSTEYPHSFFWTPVHEKVNDVNSKVVAVFSAGGSWDRALRNLLPKDVTGLYAVVYNSCNQTYSYLINGEDALYQGEGDMHDSAYDDMKSTVLLTVSDHPNFTRTPGHCIYSMDLYPSTTFQNAYDSRSPEIFAIVVACTFVAVAVIFLVYDIFVQRRNTKVVSKAAESGALVSNVFPSHIRDRVALQRSLGTQQSFKSRGSFGTKSQMRSFLAGEDDESRIAARPIADLFLDTTVMFADIAGFTAWSSVREPAQVFTLLETVYHKFDKLAQRRGVFKVETVGDCYVAVTGLPDPRRDHAVAMARYARDCMKSFAPLVKRLEVTLGPDTGDLELRCGIHSGPVTAGVLRGERARFQLFGDTMNVTARMEGTSLRGRIQLSNEAAEKLVEAGKGNWLQMRSECIDVKGKGSLRTFWLLDKGDSGDQQESVSGDSVTAPDLLDIELLDADGNALSNHDSRIRRLVEWNVETLSKPLKQIVARRSALAAKSTHLYIANGEDMPSDHKLDKGETFLEEVKEIVELPEFDRKLARLEDSDSIALAPEVVQELRDYIGCIAHMYRDNPFHNFEHASHVVMSVVKLLSRIVAPSELEHEFDAIANSNHHGGRDFDFEFKQQSKFAASLHDHTYGITSDPLTHFACAFSALIHDADHQGVQNTQLVKEGAYIAKMYKNRSVAEQNSLALAWDLLMEDQFSNLRGAIYSTQSELKRFRELVVNSVMATDIVDKDLKQLRNGRWDKAFKKEAEGPDPFGGVEDSPRDEVNRKATIVIEHLIQASDISHTMQHWHVYRKWNERLFEELYIAYKQGRAEKNPADFWAKGEIGFFDFYIIPLARKLQECGVFGVSSGEFLSYANKNRGEWEQRGAEVVAEMMEKFGGNDHGVVEVEDTSAIAPPEQPSSQSVEV